MRPTSFFSTNIHKRHVYCKWTVERCYRSTSTRPEVELLLLCTARCTAYIADRNLLQVAVKLIKKSAIESKQDLTRIRREIRIMSALKHPNIIQIFEGIGLFSSAFVTFFCNQFKICQFPFTAPVQSRYNIWQIFFLRINSFHTKDTAFRQIGCQNA